MSHNLNKSENLSEFNSPNPNNFEFPVHTQDLSDIQQTIANSNFSLDMVSTDMDFEQAYLMYTNLQQEQALSAVEQLQKVQALNQQYVNMFSNDKPSTPNQSAPANLNQNYNYGSNMNDKFSTHRAMIMNGGMVNQLNQIPTPSQQQQQQPAHNPQTNNEDEFDQFFKDNESNALENFLDNLASNNSNPLDFYNQTNHHQNPNQPQPQQNYNDPEFNFFDLHTMKSNKRHTIHNLNNIQQQQIQQMSQKTDRSNLHEILKREITEAFSHPPLKSLTKFDDQLPSPLDSRTSTSYSDNSPLSGSNLNHALITPPNSSNSNISAKPTFKDISLSQSNLESPPISPPLKHGLDEDEDDDDDDDLKSDSKRRRSSSKKLLTLKQKRLNHSNSEQKRRQLCKLAYERCLRLITNVEDYKSEIVLASTLSSSLSNSKKKSKRKQINKDGLPNLSKHTALLKISGEILKIKNRNDKLKKLLEQAS